MNTTLTGQVPPTDIDVLSLITTDEDEELWHFETIDPPEESQSD